MGKVTRPGSVHPPSVAGWALIRPLQVFYDHGSLFGRFKHDWSWGWAYLYAAAGLLGGNLMALANASRLVEANLEAASVPQALIDFDMKLIQVANLLLPWVSPLIQAFLMATVVQFLCVFMNVRVRFSKLFSLVMHSFLPTYLVGQLVKGALAMIMPPEAILRINLSPAILLPNSQVGSWLYLVLSTFDVFIVASLVLLALGFAVAQKQSRVRGTVCATVLYGVILLQTLMLSPAPK